MKPNVRFCVALHVAGLRLERRMERLNEALAAKVILLSPWEREQFLDAADANHERSSSHA